MLVLTMSQRNDKNFKRKEFFFVRGREGQEALKEWVKEGSLEEGQIEQDFSGNVRLGKI